MSKKKQKQKQNKKTLAWAGVSRRSVTPRDLSNTGSPAGFPKTRGKKCEGLLRIKSAMLSLCLCECGPHSPIATTIFLTHIPLHIKLCKNILNKSLAYFPHALIRLTNRMNRGATICMSLSTINSFTSK